MMEVSCKLYFYMLLLACAVQISCSKELNEVSFSEVSTLVPILGPGLGEVELIGAVNDKGKNEVVRQGFILSYTRSDVEGNLPGAEKNASFLPDGIMFHALVDQLNLDSQYYFRAFAEFSNPVFNGTRVAYGDILDFTFNIDLIVPSLAEVSNDSAVLMATMTGLINEFQGVDHGFVFSSIHPEPEYNQAGTDNISFGALDHNETFNDTIISSLSFNTTYYYRAWIKTADTIYYSNNIGLIVVKDGWKHIYSFPMNLRDATAIVVGDKVYILGGCTDDFNCNSGQNFNETWLFDPAAITLTELASFPAARHNGIGFSIGENVFFGSGELEDLKIFYDDLWKRNVTSGTWIPINSVGIPERSRAIAFTINGKGYFGTGIGPQGHINDFWQFDGNTNFRQMMRLNLKSTESTEPVSVGRIDAIAFESGGKGYVMGGSTVGGFDLKDIWEFTPPMSSDTLDKGVWNFIGFFEGKPRSKAIVFTIDGKAYIGTGRNLTDGLLSDMWRFCPDCTEDQKFTAVTPFPLGGRDRGIAFAVNGKGYFGTGASSGTHNDLWEYTPPQN